MRFESYWYLQDGKVEKIDMSADRSRYNVTVKFERANYSGVTKDVFELNELKAKDPISVVNKITVNGAKG